MTFFVDIKLLVAWKVFLKPLFCHYVFFERWNHHFLLFLAVRLEHSHEDKLLAMMGAKSDRYEILSSYCDCKTRPLFRLCFKRVVSPE